MHKDFLEYEAILKRVSYKPNARFEMEYREGFALVTMLMDVPDVNTGDTTTITSNTRFPCGHSLKMEKEEFFVNLILGKLITQIEMHEKDEWFKLDGEFVRDPHPKTKVYGYD